VLRIAVVDSAVADPRVAEPVEVVVAAMGAVPRDAVTMVGALRVVEEPVKAVVAAMAAMPRAVAMIVADRKVAEPVKAVVMMAVEPRDAVLKDAATMGVERKAVVVLDGVAPVLNRVVVDHLGDDSSSF
jgi:hypothetical protein